MLVVGPASRAVAAGPVSLPTGSSCASSGHPAWDSGRPRHRQHSRLQRWATRVHRALRPATQVALLRRPVGWWDDATSCYWKLLDPSRRTVSIWQGHYPTGAIYRRALPAALRNSSNGGWAWRASPPPGYGATSVTPAQLAQQAVDRMALTGPAIGCRSRRTSSPRSGCRSGCGPRSTPTTWGPNSATASVPGLSVTATARARQIVWDTGDGRSETCRNPGHPLLHGRGDEPDVSARLRPLVGRPTGPGVHGDGDDDVGRDVDRRRDVGGVDGDPRPRPGSVRVGEVQVLVTTG